MFPTIRLTPRAAERIKTVVARDGKPGSFLRLKVVPGGCSGMSYEFSFTDQKEPEDVILALDGAPVAVDRKSGFFLNGSTLDWVQTLMKSGFEVKNPNASGSCECGVSFSTDAFPAPAPGTASCKS